MSEEPNWCEEARVSGRGSDGLGEVLKIYWLVVEIMKVLTVACVSVWKKV